MVFIGFWYSVFDIWDSVFGTWDCAHLVFGILNEGEKRQNGRVARFAVSLKTDPCASARFQHCTWEESGLIAIAIAYNQSFLKFFLASLQCV